MTVIKNVAGEAVYTGKSDAEAVRFWLESGRSGDYVDDTGELVSTVATDLGFPFHFDQSGCVVDDGKVDLAALDAEAHADDLRNEHYDNTWRDRD